MSPSRHATNPQHTMAMRRCTARLSHREVLSRSLKDPAGFWHEQAKALYWDTPPKDILVQRENGDEWFVGGTTNLCVNAVDVHCERGLGDKPALRYDSPVSSPGSHHVMTYNEVRTLVDNIAGMLVKEGVRPGDRVLIYMAMTLEAQCAMLACARVGAVHVVCFGGFAAPELAKRIVDCEPSLILATSCGIPLPGKVVDYKTLLDQALEMSGVRDTIKRVIVRRPELVCDLRGNEVDFYDSLASSPEKADPVFLPSGDASYLIFTSGTTGKPKGVVRDIGGYATVLKWSMKAVYGLDEQHVMFAASDIGWVVGHSYIVYGPLLAGCQSVVYEGKPVGTPDAGAYWRVIEDHKVNCMFASPTGFRAVKRDDHKGALFEKYDVSTLRSLFLAGERSDSDTLQWARDLLKLPVHDHWWQTESGWPITSPCMGLTAETESAGAGLPVPGWNVHVVDSAHADIELDDDTEMGNIVIKRPLPPGMVNRLWGCTPDEFAARYLTKCKTAYVSGDAGYIDRDGHVHILTRTDDIMNVGAVRLSSGLIEEAIAAHESVAEGVVVGLRHPLKGEAPVAFYVVNSDEEGGVSEAAMLKELNGIVEKTIGGFARLHAAVRVHRLPKTRSGKVLRITIRSIVNGDSYSVPVTIEVCVTG